MKRLTRGLLGLLSPAGARARLSVLIFHRVLARPDPLFPGEVDAARFDALCAWLAPRFHVLALDEAVRRLEEGRLPARSLAITFDDGYADNHDVALPILRRHGLCATFFIATGFLDGGRMWNDTIIEAVRGTARPRLDLSPDEGFEGGPLDTSSIAQRRVAIGSLIGTAKYLAPADRASFVSTVARAAGSPLPDDLMMTSTQVQALHGAGMQIGAHTVTHPILAALDDAAARDEIVSGKVTLENLIQQRVTVFAYPNGRPSEDYSAASVALVREAGFDAAVSTAWGVSRTGADRLQIPRFTPWDRSLSRWGWRLTANLQRTTFATV